MSKYSSELHVPSHTESTSSSEDYIKINTTRICLFILFEVFLTTVSIAQAVLSQKKRWLMNSEL
jgi:hypothetical protein